MYDIHEKINQILDKNIGEHIAFVKAESKEIIASQLTKLFLDRMLKESDSNRHCEGSD